MSPRAPTTPDERAILERREALLRNLRRGVAAFTGVVATATACPCLSPTLEPLPCPDAGDAGDGGSARCGTGGADAGPDDAGSSERG